MGSSGYRAGVEIGKMLEHKFVSKPAQIMSKVGQFVGVCMLGGGLLVSTFVPEIMGSCLLVSVGGVAMLLLTHWIALQMDKKHAPKA